MSVDNPPSLEEFLAAPPETVARVAPATAVYAPGGTRRSATLAGVPLTDDSYIQWVRPQLIENIALFFRLGVQHLIIPSIGPRNFQEGGVYGRRLVSWLADVVAGPAMLADYKTHGWQGRMLGVPALPLLAEAAARVQQATAGFGPHTIWWYLVADNEDPWREVLAMARQTGAQTRAEAIRALYGADIPPADLYIGFGKPFIGTTMVPPLLTGESLHGYWTQRPGMQLTERVLRAILYDYAYSRRTWEADHSARYLQAHKYAGLWDTDYVLGIGSKRDGYWYPNAFTIPTLPDDPTVGGA